MLVNDLEQLRATTEGAPTIVVVGAGAVGLYAASELAKRGRRVLVVESGGRHLGSFPKESWTSVGMRHEGIELARSRSLGGTSNLWGGQLVEFQPVDFAGRDWIPGSRWPVTYDEVAPFYRVAYDNFGLLGDVQDDDAVWASVSSSRPVIGDQFEAFLTRWLKIPSFAQMYAQQYDGGDAFAVLLDHTVVGFEGTDGRVTAVRVVDPAGAEHAIAGETIVLAAGTIENARLLLHGAADPSWACPWRTNTHLGTHFQDHLGGAVAAVRPVDRRRFFDTFSTIVRGGQKYQPKFRLRNDVLARDHILNIQGLFGFESSVSENLVYLKQFVKAALYRRKVTGVGDFVKATVASWKHMVPLMWRYVWDHRIFVPSTSKISLLVQAEQLPTAKSRITLDAGARDAYGLPRVVLDWHLGGDELDSVLEFARRADVALRRSGLAHLDIDEQLAARNPRFLDSLGDTYHQAGGTIMGFSDHDGVVDRDLRVFGTDNLYVAGASTFRTVSNANTTFTAIALATRLVYHLCGEHPPD